MIMMRQQHLRKNSYPETHNGAKSAGQKRANIMCDKSDILKHG